jgi:hypothetical protein
MTPQMRPEKQLTSPTILLPFLAEVFTSVKREKEVLASPFEDYWRLLNCLEFDEAL